MLAARLAHTASHRHAAPPPLPPLRAGLKKFLKKHAEGDTLAVLDAKLGSVIKEKLGINCLYRWAACRLLSRAAVVDGGVSWCAAGMCSQPPSSCHLAQGSHPLLPPFPPPAAPA